MSEKFDAIPDELKERDQWLMWDSAAETPRRPHYRGNFGVGWSDPDDWHGYEDVVEAAGERESWGIGYVFAKSNEDYPRGVYGGLDLDGCISEDGEPAEWLPSLQPFFDAGAYMETSPGGDGIHVPLAGFEPPEWWKNAFVSQHEGVEAYGSKFFTFTGDTLEGCGESVADNGEFVEEWLREAYENIKDERPWEDNEDEQRGRERHERPAGGYDEADGMEDVFRAIDALDARDVAEKTIVSGWNDDAGTSEGNRAFYPTWGPNCNGTANIVDEDGWTDTGTDSGSGGPLEMAAIDLGELRHSGCEWGDASGSVFGKAVEHLRDLGFNIPETSRSPNSWAAPTTDDGEVDRAEALLAAECSRTDPAGELEHRNGRYAYWHEGSDGGGAWNAVTNFTLETLEHLKTDMGDLLKLRVHPAHPMEDAYDVDVHPTVFNETRTFKEEIVRGRTTRYEPGKLNQKALNDLRETVGSQIVPERVGVEHIGLAGDDFDEWVSPKGTLTADGPAEDPEHRYYAKGGASDSDGGALARKWQLDPEQAAEFDEETVANILELFPRTRKHARGLPLLGWFYAAPLRPLIHNWEGDFNILQVIGSTGTGKTSTLKAYWEAFGMDPDPFSASDTPFTIMKHLASSSGVPVWIDEYKPADIRNDRLDMLHRRLRESTSGAGVPKGLPNFGEVLFELKAPVVVSGEQKFPQSVPAVRRRAVMTTLSEEATREGSEHTRAFSELTGTPYEDENGTPQYPEGYDLSEHASAYYRYILRQDSEDLRDLWNDTRERTAEVLTARGLSLEKTEFQGAQTVLFGVRVYRRFAAAVGADEAAMPTDEEVADAFEHYASNIGKDGKRMGYDDAFLELFAQAASEGYLDRDDDFRFLHSRKWGCEVLAFHMPTANREIRRFVRDYNLEDEYTLVNKADYLSGLKDKIGQENSHVKAVNHKVNLDGGGTKCVLIDPHRTREVLGSGFDLRAFGRGDPEEAEETEGTGGDDDGGDGPSATTDAASQPTAAADGGSTDAAPPADAEDVKADAQRLKKWVSDAAAPDKPGMSRVKCIQLLTDRRERTPEAAENVVDYALRNGLLQEAGDGYEAT